MILLLQLSILISPSLTSKCESLWYPSHFSIDILIIRLSTYVIVAAFFAGLTYLAYLSYVPQKRSRSKKGTSSISAPVGPATATGVGGFQEEWIPEHHLRKSKSSKKTGTGGDELSGGDTSGAEGKKKKTR